MIKENFFTFILLLSLVFTAFVSFFLVEKGKKRIIMAIVSSLLIVISVNMIFNVTGTPRPGGFEIFFEENGRKYRIEGMKINKNEGIYLWLTKEKEKIPIYLRFKYSEEAAAKLKKAMEEGKKSKKGKTVLVKRKNNSYRIEPSLEDFDIKHEIDFPEAPPPKDMEKYETEVIE